MGIEYLTCPLQKVFLNWIIRGDLLIFILVVAISTLVNTTYIVFVITTLFNFIDLVKVTAVLVVKA